MACSNVSFPSNAALRETLGELGASPSSCADYSKAVTELVSGACPDPPVDSWLCLAMLEVGDRFRAGRGHHARGQRHSGAGLAVIHTGSADADTRYSVQRSGGGALAPGPSVSSVAFEGVDGNTTTGSAILHLGLLPDPGRPGPTIPIEATTFAASHFSLSRFDAGTGWTDIVITAVLEPSPARFVGTGSGTLGAGRYRLVLDSPVKTPIVDARRTRLRPTPFVWQFRLEEQDGALALAESLFE